MQKQQLTKLVFIFVLVVLLAGTAIGQQLPINKGPYQPTDESLKQYKYPDWFRDAKFGIWAHWGPQAVPRHGDWYARQLYEEGRMITRITLPVMAIQASLVIKILSHYGRPKDGIPKN